MAKPRFQLFLLIFNLAFFSSFSAHAFLGSQLGIPTTQDYQQFETKNFILTYPSANLPEALKSAFYLEKAHETLTEYFKYEPDHKTRIILTDHVDSANGVTSTTGSQGIVLYLTAPDPYLSIGEYDQWLKNLVFHEYTHYITLGQRRGFFAFLKYLFGDLFYPNNAWPTWLAEGFAVYVESKYTMGGRGDGTFYNTLTRDAIYRSKKLNDKHAFRKLHELSGQVPDFPFGEEQYYVGYAVLEQMTREYGENAPSLFAYESSWRIPYFLNGTLGNVSDQTTKKDESMSSLWNKWIAAETPRHEESLNWLALNSKTPITEFDEQEPGNIESIRLSPDGKKLGYIFSSGHELPQIIVWDNFFEERGRKLLFKEDAISGPGISFSKDGKNLIYSKEEYFNRYFFSSDLYLHNFEKHQTYRLTKNERAKDPDLCGDQGVVYTSEKASLAEIRYLDLKTRKIKVLYRALPDSHISNPRCDSEGNTIYFSEHGNKMWETAKSISLLPQKVENLFGGPKDGFGALFLEPTPDGIFFTKVLNGYYLLSRWDPVNKKVENILASSGGIWAPSFSKRTGSRVVFTHLTSQGFKVAWADLDLNKNKPFLDPPLLPTKDRFTTLEKSNQMSEEAKNVLKKPELVEVQPPHSYSFLSNQAPRIWSPFLLLSDKHNQIGASFTGWDDLDILRYQVLIYYDNIPRSFEGTLDLNARIGTFNFSPFLRREISDFLMLTTGDRLYEEEFGIGAVLSRPVPFDFWTFIPGISLERLNDRIGGDFGVQSFDPEYRFGASIAFDSRHSVHYSILPELGRYFEVTAKHFNTFKTENRKSTTKGWVKWEEYFRVFPRHASLFLSATAAHTQRAVYDFPSSRLKIGGSGSIQDLDPPLRGYPRGNFEMDSALLGTAEYRFPIFQIFDGIWDLPVFFKNIGAFGFYDIAKMNKPGFSNYADSVGGGFLVNTLFGYYFPAQFKVQMTHGFKYNLNAENAFSVELAL